MTESVVLSVQVQISSFGLGGAPLELELFKSDSANDVYAAFGYSPQVQHITSYNLFYQGKLLEFDTPLESLLGSDNQKTLILEAKPKAYTAKSIIDHLITVRGIVGIQEEEPFGLNQGISKINELNFDPIVESEEVESSPEPEEDSKPKELPVPTAEEKAKVSELVSSIFTQLPKDFNVPNQVIIPAVRALYLSSWNPVPLNFKSKGHLVYIFLQTIENEVLHITGTTTGFYINKSTNAKFDPSLKESNHKAFNLFDLINQVSKAFIGQIKQNNEKLASVDPVTFLKPQTTYLSTPWITKPVNINSDFGRIQLEDNNYRDFNDEIQSLKEFPGKSLQDRIVCERLLAKNAHEFTNEAVKGALSIINGGIPPMEVTEDPLSQIYLNNGIFYSFAVDTGSFTDKGGNDASRASSNQDLQTLNFLNQLESKGIYTLMTTIVDYAGKRVVAQTPVPGLFSSSEPQEITNQDSGEIDQVDGEPLTKIDYGKDENEGVIKSNEDFVKGLETIGKALHFKKQKIDGAELATSPDIKGMIGTDKRKYIIDLFNATPLDIEFIEANYKAGSEDSYPHKQTVVRLEAVQQWWTYKLNELITKEAELKGIDLTAQLKEGDKLPEINVDESTLLFSVDAFQSGSKEDANVRDLSKFIKSNLIPKFIDQFDASLNIVPIDGAHLTSTLHKAGVNIRYLGEVSKQLQSRIEKSKIEESEALSHNEELNKKYEEKLNEKNQKITEELKKKAEAEAKGETYEIQIPEKDDEEEDEKHVRAISTKLISYSKLYEGLLDVVNQELIARASKHILRSYSLNLPVELIPSLVAHYHNCLLGTKFNENPTIKIDNSFEFYSEKDLEFTKLTPSLVKELIEKTVSIRYRTSLPANWFENISPLKLQREISNKFGLQWILRDYYYSKELYEESKNSSLKDKKAKKSKQATPEEVRINVFDAEDVSLAPIIKTTIPRSSTGEQYFETGRIQLASSDEEKKQEGLTLITESISIYIQTYGQVHPEVQRLHSSLASIYRDLGRKPEATIMARRSAAISERVFGLDSHETVVAYLNLAYFEAENGNISNSLKAFARISQIWTTVFNNEHISIPTIGGDIATLLQDRGYLDSAVVFISKLIELAENLHGGDSYTLGYLKFRLGYLYGLGEKYQASLKASTESHNILSRLSSANHYLTKRVRGLQEQMSQVVRYQEQNAKVIKEQAKLESQKAAQSIKQHSKKPASNVDLTNKSVDEVLNFVLGKNASGKKKSKKAKN